jgi:hypothetical protein
VAVEDQRPFSPHDQCAQCGATRSSHQYTEYEKRELEELHRRIDAEHGYDYAPHDHSEWQPSGLNSDRSKAPVKYHTFVEGEREPWPEQHEFDRASLEQALKVGGGEFKTVHDYPWTVKRDGDLYKFRSGAESDPRGMYHNGYNMDEFHLPVDDTHAALGFS